MNTVFNTCTITALTVIVGQFTQSAAIAQTKKSDRVAVAQVSSVPRLLVAQTKSTQLPAGVVLPAFSKQRVTQGRDRFLNEPVLTTDALVESLKTNKTFRRNIAKHFRLPEERVVEFVQDALVPYILPRDTTVNNFGVTRRGMIYGKKMILKKGSRVWATRDGKPILKWICSNPLLTKIPILKEKPKPSTVSLRRSPLGVQQVAAELSGPAGLDALPQGSLAPLGPPDPVPIKVAVEPTPGPVRQQRVARAGLPLLPLAGVAGAVVRSVKQPVSVDEDAVDPGTLNTGAPGRIPVATRAVSQQFSAVPEPGTFALALLGLAGLPLLRRRK